MKLKLKKPSQESIIKAIVEGLTEKLTQNVNEITKHREVSAFDIVNQNEIFTVHFDFISEHILDIATKFDIENFGECNKPTELTVKLVQEMINNTIETKEKKDRTVFGIANNLLKDQLLKGVSLSKEYLTRQWYNGPKIIQALDIMGYKFSKDEN